MNVNGDAPTSASEPALFCALCRTVGRPEPEHALQWYPPDALAELMRSHPGWRLDDGACPACVQQALLTVFLRDGDPRLHSAIQQVWPLDTAAAFPAIPTPLRLHADPRFTGRGVTIAFVDAGFVPHPDLVRPVNRIRAWVDASRDPVVVRRFDEQQTPSWPESNSRHNRHWHGLMTTAAAAGNGHLSHGLYRGLASNAGLVLIQTRDNASAISDHSIARALEWLAGHHAEHGVRVVNVSLGGDAADGPDNRISAAVRSLVGAGVVVVAAAGNDGVRRLTPPASTPEALTIGGLDDRNDFDHASMSLWHSNHGPASSGALKPEVVAPSIWVAAPILPGTPLAEVARDLFAARHRVPGAETVERALAERRLVTPHYQHMEGTSIAAPLAASLVACLLEANPTLSPEQVRHILVSTARPVPGAPPERQGAGTLVAGTAVAGALAFGEQGPSASRRYANAPGADIVFELADSRAARVAVFGAWDRWERAVDLHKAGPGAWTGTMRRPAAGCYPYKFLVDETMWMADPVNPNAASDGLDGFNSLLTVS